MRRDAAIIVVVADVADLWALERAHAVNARYHVLGGTLSPLDGIGPQDLTIDALVSRAHDPAVTEVILALNATVDGQTTAHYITDLLHDANVKVTRLAHGVPVGGELDYLDEGTLSAAIRQRTRVLASRRAIVRVGVGQAPAKCPRCCSQTSSTRLGSAASELMTKNSGQPVASATKPAPADR